MSKTRITREEIRDRARELKNERADIEDTSDMPPAVNDGASDGFLSRSHPGL